MTPADLEFLIQQGEGTTLEFKENLSSSFAREVVALANTIGGKILLGVSDSGSVIGVKDTNTLRGRVQDVARNCDPPVKVLAEPVDGVLATHVRESNAKPVKCSEGFFWRQGAVTQKMSRKRNPRFLPHRGRGPVRPLALLPLQLSGGFRPREVRRLACPVRHHRKSAGRGRAGQH